MITAQLWYVVQVLGEIFNAIHRADLGGEADKAADPQLPHKVRLPAASGAAAANSRPAANGVAPLQKERQSLVQRLFGLDVQVGNFNLHPCSGNPRGWCPLHLWLTASPYLQAT